MTWQSRTHARKVDLASRFWIIDLDIDEHAKKTIELLLDLCDVGDEMYIDVIILFLLQCTLPCLPLPPYLLFCLCL